MEKDLKLDKDDYEIIHKEKIAGCNLFNLTNKKLRDWGMAGGPARRLLNFTSEIKEKTSRAFSLTNMSSEILASNNEYIFSETLESNNEYIFSVTPVSGHVYFE
ncbi:unnamed protein product [Rhizophagus irregularis]|nr:unnamed protein product [Rhizophagus irregularis]